MGKIDFSELRPQAPIEALLGASAVARGIYLYIANSMDKNTVVTTHSNFYNAIVGTIFLASGIMLMIGALRDYFPFRITGLCLVAGQTALVLIRTISEGVTTLPLVIGNMTMLAVCAWLVFLLLYEEE